MTAQSRYDELARRRQPFLDRARDCAALTIPSLITPEGHTGTSKLYEPYQDLGAELVNHSASKMTTALYPPGQPSFRLTVTSKKLLENGEMDVPEDVERGLSLTEKLVRSEIEMRGWRAQTNLSIQHLMVAGNVGEMTLPSNKIKVYRLDQYVAVRDPAGEMIEYVIKESFSPANLPEEIRNIAGSEDETTLIDVYTWGTLKDDVWTLHQEVNGKELPKSRGTYKVSPFNALRWIGVAGEDYGRGKIEDHLPSLRKLEVLSQGLTEGTALATRHVGMVRPGASGGLRLRRRLAKAENGDIIIGDPDHVGSFRFENIQSLEVAERYIQQITQQLRAAFLMNTSVQRDAERVTAYELQLMTQELEGALGGVYSMLAADMQQHRIKRLMAQMMDQGALPELEDGAVMPVILTGLEAIGRQGDVGKVIQGMNIMQNLDPEERAWVKMDQMLKKGFNGLDLADTIRSQDEYTEHMQERAALQAMSAGGEALAQGAAQAATAPQQ